MMKQERVVIDRVTPQLNSGQFSIKRVVGQSVACALFGLNVVLRSLIVGLGGRDVTKDEIEYAAKKMKPLTDNRGKLYDYLGVRETKDKMWEVRF